MAKLEGVKVIDMVDGEVTKVSFEGGVYELTFEQAQVGDVLFNINDAGSQRANTYYKVVEVDEYARVSDENDEANGWKHRLQGDYFKVYRRALTEGDYVVPTEESETKYNITSFPEMKLGKITDAHGDGVIEVSIVKHSDIFYENEWGYRVSDKYFRLATPEEIGEETGKEDAAFKPGDKVRDKGSGEVVEVYAYQPEKRTRGIGSGHKFSSPQRGFTYIDDGYEYWDFIDDFELVEESAKPIDRKHVKVGDKIRITDPDLTFGIYDKGDEMVVKEIDGDGDVTETDKTGVLILRSEFEIIGEAEDETEGGTFRKVDNRDAKVGDFLTFSADEDLPSYLKHGKKYEIMSFDVFGDAYINDEDGDEFDTCGCNFDVFEKVTNIEVGDTVKIKYGGQMHALCGFDNGHVCKVIGHSHSGRLHVGDDEGREGFAHPEQLEKVDDTPTPTPKLKEGDKVRISIPEYEETRHSRAGVTNDEIGTVESVREPGVTVNFPSYGSGWSGIVDELDLVEIEVGDTVRLNIECGESPYCGWGRVSNGDAGTVHFIRGDMIDVNFPAQEEWTGKRYEFELVSKAQSQHEANEETTKIVVKEGEIYVVDGPTHYDDIEVGTNVRVTDANYREGMARVELLDGTDFDYIKPENLAEIKAEVGDIVSFERDDGASGVGVVEDVTESAQGVGVRSGNRYYAVIRRDGGKFTIVAKKAQRLDVVSDD